VFGLFGYEDYTPVERVGTLSFFFSKELNKRRENMRRDELVCILCAILVMTSVGMLTQSSSPVEISVADYTFFDGISPQCEDLSEPFDTPAASAYVRRVSQPTVQYDPPEELDFELSTELTRVATSEPEVDLDLFSQGPTPSTDFALQEPSPMQLPPTVPHLPIEILDDDDFEKQAKKEGWTGTGVFGDPYIIEGYEIDLSYANEYCIRIENIETTYFIIRDCVLLRGWGISLYNVKNAVLYHNFCTFNNRGIDLVMCSQCEVLDNTCNLNSIDGISIGSCEDVMVQNNMCFDNSENGIIVNWVSTDITVDNNDCWNNQFNGIYMWYYCSSNDITYNTCFDNGLSGVNVSICKDIDVIENFCHDNGYTGISFEESENNLVMENNCTRNEWALLLLQANNTEVSHNNCSFNYNGVYAYESSHNDFMDNNCTGQRFGIGLRYGVDNEVLRNNCSDNNVGNDVPGLFLARTNHSFVIDNTCDYNGHHGIGLYSTEWNEVFLNSANHSYYSGIIVSSSNCTLLMDNTCNHNNDFGVYITDSEYSGVVLSTITDNGYSGVLVEESISSGAVGNWCDYNGNHGIELISSNGSIVDENWCRWNENNGIELSSSNDNELTWNHCLENENHGIHLTESHRNILDRQYCIDNAADGIYLYVSNENEFYRGLSTDNRDGVKLHHSHRNVLSGLNCTGNRVHGIYLNTCNSNQFFDNECNRNGQDGITLVRADHSELISNTCSQNGIHGIYLINDCNKNEIIANECNDNEEYGIRFLTQSDHNKAVGNTCNNNIDGITLERSNNITLTSNICNYNDDYGINADESNESVFMKNTCNGNLAHGIHVYEFHRGEVTDNTCTGNRYGIYFYHSEHSTISENTCKDNQQYGLHLFGFHYGDIIGNTFSKNNRGVGVSSSDSNDFIENTCNGNFHEGIYLYFSERNDLERNVCNDNLDEGIQVFGGQKYFLVENTCSNNSNGIWLTGVQISYLYDNVCEDNARIGIGLSNGCSTVLLKGNSCNRNSRHGISLYKSNSIRCYQNYCVENGGSGITLSENYYVEILYTFFRNNEEHSLSCGTDVRVLFVIYNYFGGSVIDDSTGINIGHLFMHNYYFEYGGPDNDGDGIGDVPYTVPGVGSHQDEYPLVFSPIFLWTTPPTDLTIEFGERLSLMNLNLDVDDTIPTGELTWTLNDTENFSINNEGRITDMLALPVGTYTLNVSVANVYNGILDRAPASYGIDLYPGFLSAIFTVTVADTSIRWSLELNGNFDYPDTELALLQIGAFLTYAETGAPISGAHIQLTIYNPDGTLLWILTMSEVEPGVYVYRTPGTISYYVSNGIWEKGIYLVVGEASIGAGEEVKAKHMTQFHIDPPAGQGPDMAFVLALGTIAGLLILDSVIAGRYLWKRRRGIIDGTVLR
jgi:parallel beta-helix repeat protein